jgi:cholesterol oxidase
MQTLDNHLRVDYKRSPWTFLRKGLVTKEIHQIPPRISVGHQVTHAFAERTNGISAGSLSESLFGLPLTAHILGGVPMGRSDQDGVVDIECRVFNYPGLYVVDGSIMPANPGINPSLTITALAEHAMSRIPPKPGGQSRKPIKVDR